MRKRDDDDVPTRLAQTGKRANLSKAEYEREHFVRDELSLSLSTDNVRLHNRKEERKESKHEGEREKERNEQAQWYSDS